jgi:hypothetical protein
VGARAFMQVAMKGTMFVIYATSTTESVKGPKALPTLYKEYQDVFEKKNAVKDTQEHNIIFTR